MRKNSLKMWALLAFAALIFLSFMIGSVLNFHQILSEDEYELQKDTLMDLSMLEASILEVRLEGYTDSLNTIAELMQLNGRYNPDYYKETLNAMLSDLDFYQLGIITTDGVLHDTHGEVSVADRDYCQAVLQGEKVVSGNITSRITGQQVVALAVPVYDAYGQLRGAVHGTIRLDMFDPYTNTSLTVGNVNTCIFDSGGEYIYKNNQNTASYYHTNIFDHVTQAEGGISIEELRASIQDRLIVITELISGGVPYLCCFLPIQNSEWYVLVDIPTAEIDAYVASVLDQDFFFMLISISAQVLLLCALILIWNHRRNLRERKREIELRERLMAQVVGLMVVDLDMNFIVSRSGRGVLRAETEITSYPDYIANFIHLGAHPDHRKAIAQYFDVESIRRDAEAGFMERNTDFLFRYRPNGEYVWLECETHLSQDGASGHLTASHILRDINKRKQEELHLRDEAEHDMLTGLYNRATGTKLIEHRLKAPDSVGLSAMILMDLDNFKKLNDTLGHQLGDQALKDVANILSAHFRKDDIICRLGGDEFIVFLKDVTEDSIRGKLSLLLDKLSLQYILNGQSVAIHASAGVVFVSGDESFDQLYQNADRALYQAKREGKGTFREGDYA